MEQNDAAPPLLWASLSFRDRPFMATSETDGIESRVLHSEMLARVPFFFPTVTVILAGSGFQFSRDKNTSLANLFPALAPMGPILLGPT